MDPLSKILLLAIAILGCGSEAKAQMYLTPSIGGFTVRCTDATDSPVYTVGDNTINDVAMSSINTQGVRLISINRDRFSSLPSLIKLMVYAHECGHHISGDIVEGVIFHHDNINREKNADRIGIRLLRDQFGISQAQADAIASTFQNNPPMPPYYLPGPQRAQWVRNCYRTNNDSCSAGDSNISVATVTGGFCGALKVVMGDAANGFSNIIGSKIDDDTWAANRKLSDSLECTIERSGYDKTYKCKTPSSDDDSSLDQLLSSYNNQVKVCLGDSWKSEDKTTSSGNPYTTYMKPNENFYASVEKYTSTRNDTGFISVTVDQK